MKDTLFLGLFVLFLILTVVAIVTMFTMMGKKGDERRRMIVEKAAAHSFYLAVFLLVMDMIEPFFTKVWGTQSIFTDSLGRLFTLSAIFLIHMAYYNRKFGA